MQKTSSLLFEIKSFNNCTLVSLAFYGCEGIAKGVLSSFWKYWKYWNNIESFFGFDIFCKQLFTTCLAIFRVVFISQNSPCNIHKIEIGLHLRNTTSFKEYMPYNEWHEMHTKCCKLHIIIPISIIQAMFIA